MFGLLVICVLLLKPPDFARFEPHYVDETRSFLIEQPHVSIDVLTSVYYRALSTGTS